MLEGLYYTAAATVVSLCLSVLLSGALVKNLAGNMWFFTYRFTLLPLGLIIPLLLLIGLILPAGVLAGVEKQSVVERLRETE